MGKATVCWVCGTLFQYFIFILMKLRFKNVLRDCEREVDEKWMNSFVNRRIVVFMVNIENEAFFPLFPLVVYVIPLSNENRKNLFVKNSRTIPHLAFVNNRTLFVSHNKKLTLINFEFNFSFWKIKSGKMKLNAVDMSKTALMYCIRQKLRNIFALHFVWIFISFLLLHSLWKPFPRFAAQFGYKLQSICNNSI